MQGASAAVEEKREIEEEEEEVEEEAVSDPSVSFDVPNHVRWHAFPADDIRNTLLARPDLTGNLPVSDKAAVYLAEVLEYLTAELCELSAVDVGANVHERHQHPGYIGVISHENVFDAVEKDEELLEVFAAKLAEVKGQEACLGALANRMQGLAFDIDGVVDSSRLQAVCDTLEREIRCREATREFRTQFALYFNTVVHESDCESEPEERDDGSARAAYKVEDVSNDHAAYETDSEFEQGGREEATEEEGEKGDLEEEKGDGWYDALIPLSNLTSTSVCSSINPSSSSSFSSSSLNNTSSSSTSLKDTCSRFKRLFSNFFVINDTEAVPASFGAQPHVFGTTYTTTYRVMTPPRLMRAATREITLASGLPAPVVNIITDYCKHDSEIEGSTIKTMYSVGVKQHDGQLCNCQVFIVKCGLKPLVCIERADAHKDSSVDVLQRVWERGGRKLVELLSRLGVSLQCKEYLLPLLCLLFSPHVELECTTNVLLGGVGVDVRML